jgi:predicted nucleic acid-binding protein
MATNLDLDPALVDEAVSVGGHRTKKETDEPLEMVDYERAAAHFNTCRARRIQGSNTDFLICALAERRTMRILTADADFTRFATVLPITLRGRPVN